MGADLLVPYNNGVREEQQLSFIVGTAPTACRCLVHVDAACCLAWLQADCPLQRQHGHMLSSSDHWKFFKVSKCRHIPTKVDKRKLDHKHSNWHRSSRGGVQGGGCRS